MTRPLQYAAFDRDGTLIAERHYLSDPGEVELVPGAGAALRRLHEQGLRIVLVTNQSGIGRGYFDRARADAVHQRLAELLATEGARLDGIYLCPHRPDEGCSCRKPRPGLIECAARDLGFEPARGVVVGDKACDIGLAHAVGAASVLVRTGYGREQEAGCTPAPHAVADDVVAAAALIARSVSGSETFGPRGGESG